MKLDQMESTRNLPDCRIERIVWGFRDRGDSREASPNFAAFGGSALEEYTRLVEAYIMSRGAVEYPSLDRLKPRYTDDPDERAKAEEPAEFDRQSLL